MGYYRGDVFGFRGDYYQGDPGLFSFVGKALGGLAKGAVNLAKGQLGLNVGPKAPSFTPMSLAIPTFKATQRPAGALGQLGGTGAGSLTPFGPIGANYNGGGGGQNLPMVIGRHRALHWNRETYVTRGGGTSRWPQQLLVHPKGTEPVPSRRMNVGNARALKRAVRRARGFARLARSVMVITHHFKKKASKKK